MTKNLLAQTIPDNKVRFTRAESDLCQNTVRFQNIMTGIVGDSCLKDNYREMLSRATFNFVGKVTKSGNK